LFDFEPAVVGVVLVGTIGSEGRGLFNILDMRAVEVEFGTFLCV
jgi:hypothetical protein